MTRSWVGELRILALLLLAALAAGWLLGYMGWFVTLGLAAFLTRWFWQLFRLDRWLASRRLNPPEAGGIWGHVFDQCHQLRQRQLKSKKRLAQVIHEFRESTGAMPDGTLVLNQRFQILWCNPAATRLLGLVSQRDLGQPVSNLLRSPKLAAYLEAGEFEQAIEIRSPLDESRTLMLQLVPYGRQQLLLIVRDVTRLVRLQAMRRDFVANASHELRSPLTVLVGYMDLLASSDELGPDWEQPLAEMQSQCERMTSLLNDLLELSRIETDEADARYDEVINITGLIERIASATQAVDQDTHALEIEMDPGLHLRGVEVEIYSAFSNLLANALRYSPDGKPVTIRWLADDGGGAVFEVVDQGIGIEPKHLPFITQRFYRIDSSHSRNHSGTGLGLAIVKHVLKRHGAELEFESMPDQGSTFRCRFPARRAVSIPG